MWLPASTPDFFWGCRGKRIYLYWLLKTTQFIKQHCPHLVSNELSSGSPSYSDVKIRSRTSLKEEAKTQFIFASRMRSRWLVVEIEESDVYFLSLFFLKQSITVHTYSVFFFNFQFSLSQLHLLWWIRGPLLPGWVSRPERMGLLHPLSLGLCPRGGERKATLHPLGARAITTGWWNAAAVPCAHTHLGLLPPQYRLHRPRLQGGKLANICCLAVLGGHRSSPIPETLVFL